MNKKRILVIDDSADIHQDFRRLLCPERAGERDELEDLEGALFGEPSAREGESGPVFEMDSAFQGQEAIAKVREANERGEPYDMAFLDFRMPPGLNGFETLQRLREVAPSMPVVLCSAFSDYSWEEITRYFGESLRLMELRKPFNTREVQHLANSLTTG